MRPLTALAASLALLAAAPLASAQFLEPSVHLLFEHTIGPSSHLFGWAVTGIGDVNGDGVIDLAVAAPFAPGDFGRSSAGRVYALSGADGSTLWVRRESRQSAILGYALETMDWNADGVLDVVAGAPFATTGRAWVFDGSSGATLAELVGPAPGSGFGASLATGFDFDGDGVPDLAVAAPFYANTVGIDVGRVSVFERGALTPFVEIDGAAAGGQLGLGLAFVGDSSVPPDGRAELVIGSRDPLSFFDGSADVVGWDGSQVVPRFTVHGVGMGPNLLGDRIDGGGDVNGDGVPDFLVGDLFHSEVELFSGVDGAPLGTLSAPGDFGSAHFVSDRDHDGRADVVVGAWKDGTGVPDGGRVVLVSGATGVQLASITALTTGLNLGIDARECGDLDGDGRPDLAIGAYGDGFGGSLAGAALVFTGHVPAPANLGFPAELPTDPVLRDVGGDPTSGPVAGFALEPFNFSLDCRNAPSPGPWSVEVRLGRRAVPLATPLGSVWIQGGVLFRCAGVHAQDFVQCAPVPAGLVVPPLPVLIGLTYHVQGLCGGRVSNALSQTIGS